MPDVCSQRDRAVQALRRACFGEGLVSAIECLPETVFIHVKVDEGDGSFLPVAAAPNSQAAFYAERGGRLTVALDAHRARRLAQRTGHELVEVNGTTGRVAFESWAIEHFACSEHASERAYATELLDALVEALDRSASTVARSRSARAARSPAAPSLCPGCGLALPLTGVCDDHGRPDQPWRTSSRMVL